MIKDKNGEPVITWQMLVVIIATTLGIYACGVVSGYFYFRGEYLAKADARDRVVNEIKRKVDNLPTQPELKQALKEERR
ncbi:hypothetical protein AAGQ96_12885 [Pantoea sp. MBD-2R]|uniref:hypothetical protein n=1 Tax=Pantoea sp. MBD-2R TaxID=3141540 RepID=UPI0031844E71